MMKHKYYASTGLRAQRCRKLFYNCDGILSCIAPFADDITEEKCFQNKGECEFRELRQVKES
jgi:hypothetical protein